MKAKEEKTDEPEAAVEEQEQVPRFQVVVEPYSLLWPDSVSGDSVDRFRGQPGYIVDANAPGESIFLRGQEHKVIDLTSQQISSFEDKWGRRVVASKVTNPMALAAIAAIVGGVEFEPITMARQLEENEAKAALDAEADALGIPAPDDSDGATAEWEDE